MSGDKYTIDTGVPVSTMSEWDDVTNTLNMWADELGLKNVSSGTGGGIRDMQFEQKFEDDETGSYNKARCEEFKRRFEEKYAHLLNVSGPDKNVDYSDAYIGVNEPCMCSVYQCGECNDDEYEICNKCLLCACICKCD